jgi:hypothetical protein
LNPLVIAQLAVILAPLANNLVIEGGKMIASFRTDLTQDDLNKALELAKSASWPELDFGQKGL